MVGRGDATPAVFGDLFRMRRNAVGILTLQCSVRVVPPEGKRRDLLTCLYGELLRVCVTWLNGGLLPGYGLLVVGLVPLSSVLRISM